MNIAAIISISWILLQILIFLLLVFISWKFFDKRYRGSKEINQTNLLTGDFVRTTEVFVDPKDGHKYQVYYNHSTGERQYVRID